MRKFDKTNAIDTAITTAIAAVDAFLAEGKLDEAQTRLTKLAEGLPQAARRQAFIEMQRRLDEAQAWQQVDADREQQLRKADKARETSDAARRAGAKGLATQARRRRTAQEEALWAKSKAEQRRDAEVKAKATPSDVQQWLDQRKPTGIPGLAEKWGARVRA